MSDDKWTLVGHLATQSLQMKDAQGNLSGVINTAPCVYECERCGALSTHPQSHETWCSGEERP